MDRKLFKQNIQKVVFNYPNLNIMEGSVEDLILTQPSHSDKPQCAGIILGMYNHSRKVTKFDFL